MPDVGAPTPARKYIGRMFLAKRPCGKVSAGAWDNPERAAALEQTKAGWLARGDTVECIDRFVGDPEPDWICYPSCANCRSPDHAAATT